MAKEKTNTWFIVSMILIGVLVIGGITGFIVFGKDNGGNGDGGGVQIANPSAVYCEDRGHRYDIRTDESGGQYGVCIIKDYSSGETFECLGWDYYCKCIGDKRYCSPSAIDIGKQRCEVSCNL